MNDYVFRDRGDAMIFTLGSGVAGVAGVALSQLTNVNPNLGQSYIIDSFTVVVFGGVGNLGGSPLESRELLKIEAESKLDRSGIISLAADHTERRRILHAECGVVEHDVVEGVQEIG